MLSSKAIIRLSTFVAIISWAAMVLIEIFLVFSSTSNVEAGFRKELPEILLSVFILSLVVFYKYRIEKAESINFVDLLWKVFVTGLVTTVVSLLFRFFLMILGSTRLAESIILLDFIYLVNLGLICAFLISTFIVWKRLILYQKSKPLLGAWKVFEYALLVSLIYNVLPLPELKRFSEFYMGGLILLGLLLSANMKWVAYLNFRQKWKSILLIALAMFYLGYFSFTLYTSTIDIGEQTSAFLDYFGNVFIVSLMTFIFTYALFSLLVILFNLPTSSVFEQKLEEVVNFQRLSQSIQTEHSEERVYDILLESSVSTVFADAAWIQIGEDQDLKYYTYHISEEEILSIKKYLKENKVKGILDESPDKAKNLTRHLTLIKGLRYRSMIAYPIKVKNVKMGMIVLLKEVSDGFNKEMTKIIDTFANQAGISIENFRLLSEALENERYKEELKIAKRVQSSLLPEKLDESDEFEITAFSEAADEVGGDYYDTYRIDDDKLALIISDVSGKGTSAAFHMSQMKGVFHSLSQLGLDPKSFLIKANTALSKCLDKTSFITVSYFIIDRKEKKVVFARAGHCPTLYYNAESSEVSYFQNRGLGLGIVRNDSFEDYIQTNCFTYKCGDVLVLYTDGITEAKNSKGEEYGYDRLKATVSNNINNAATIIQDKLIQDLYSFSGSEIIDDDYTTLIIKFK